MTDDDPTEPSGDFTPIPPPQPEERESLEEIKAAAVVEAEDRAAREAANIPRTTNPAPRAAAEDRAAHDAANIPRPTNPAPGATAGDRPAHDAANISRAPTNPPPVSASEVSASEVSAPEVEPTATVEPLRPPDVWDGIGAWLVNHGALPALGIITIAIAIIHFRIFFGETAGDDLTFHYAESRRIADCLAAGDFDFWNPSANAGYASLYYYQAIPQLASAIPAAIFGHHLFWFQLSVVLPLILAPACAYKGMRLFGATPWQALGAAFCVGFMNGESRWGAGNAGTFVVGLYTQTWALCAFPLALAYAAKWVTEGKNLASAVAWSGFVLLCHPFAGISLGLAVLIAFVANMIMRFAVDPLLQLIAPSLRGRYEFFERRWSDPPKRPFTPELVRSAVLAVLFVITALPVALPLLIDGEGFGGFPHRVSDEVGPGFGGLWKWYSSGSLLDFINKGMGARIMVLSGLVPVALVFARGKFFRWLWAPAALYALALGFGPDLGKIGDDLIPPVRFLGAMQTLLAMGVGAGVIIIGQNAWQLVERWPKWTYAVRTALAAAVAVLTVLIAVPGSRALAARVRVFGDSDPKRPELVEIAKKLATLPQGRKQAGPGAENHWYNMLPYAWQRIPSTLQMGGGGLQASPNYDFLWTQRNQTRVAWIFDAPYLVFNRSRDKDLPTGVTELQTANFEIRRLPAPGLVSPVTVTGILPPGYRHDGLGHKKALDWIKGESPMKDEVLGYYGFGRPTERAKGKTIRSWHQDSPGDDADIVAEVEAEAPTTFVIRESWHPRWHAYIDGEEVHVRRVTPDFPAVDVGVGKHTIELRFERPLWAHLAWLAWPLAPLGAWLATRRRRRKGATGDDAYEDVDPAVRELSVGILLVVVGPLVALGAHSAAAIPVMYLLAVAPLVVGAVLVYRGVTRRRRPRGA